MKNILMAVLGIIIMMVIVIVAAFSPREYKKEEVPRNNSDYRVMSFNLKNAASDYEGWLRRRETVLEILDEYDADSFGVQEADSDWMSYLPEMLTDYDYVGVGRDDGDTQGEYAAIFYLKEKYEVLDSGNFWLSETPDIPSLGWDANNIRICTYVVLKNIDTNEVYVHMNTHLDHLGEEAKIKGSELLIEKSEEFEYPVVLSGDFNFIEGSKYYKVMKDSHFENSRRIADDSMFFGTINYFTKYHFKWFPSIDYLFVTDEFEVDTYRVIYQYKIDGIPVSDHHAIYIDFSLES